MLLSQRQIVLPPHRLATFMWLLLVTAIVFGWASPGVTLAEEAERKKKEEVATLSATEVEFFETRIRPILVERCYECHNTAEIAEADLALDSRDGIRTETEHGAVVVPGKPDESLLLKVIRHELPDLEMPEGGPKLDASVVEDFRKWISMGAPDPRNKPPSAKELSEETSWDKTLEKRKQWWSFQPIRNVWPPAGATAEHPVDQFIRAKLSKQKLEPAGPADRRTLIRRLSFALTGLPPSTDKINAFVNDESVDAFENLVDLYLDSEHFGERWARHWMDLLRYTDSHGSEGDPTIPHAYRYRDYLIRALNADVPYDKLVREHLAGDLLAEPRINDELGIDESAIGPAHFRFVFHGFAPTDALDERVRFTDDQVNVVSKAFLGLTVSCARCHDHKFDAISQADYYAMAGIFGSCRPALRDVNVPEKQTAHIDDVAKLKRQLRGELAKDWLTAVDDIAQHLLEPTEELAGRIEKANQAEELLHFWKRLTSGRDKDVSLEQAWNDLQTEWRKQNNEDDQPDNARHWDLTNSGDYREWFAWGNGMPEKPTSAGEFTINREGAVVQGIFPPAVISHSTSQRHAGFLASERFKLDEEYDAWMLVAGGGQPSLRYVVENYPRNGTVYPIPTINKANFHWQRLDLKYWTGDNIHFELATSKDAPLQNRNRDESWFAVRQVMLRKAGDPSPQSVSLEYLSPIFKEYKQAPKDKRELADWISGSIRKSIKRWKDAKLDAREALLLKASLAILPNEIESLPNAKPTIVKIRGLQSEIPEPTRVPGIVEADAFDQPLYVRGDHRKPADPVKRRFLEAIDPEPYSPKNSGRLEFADSLLDDHNPLTSRVIANRIWHYLFGQGIVSTPDNFGQLGNNPSHPMLLDYLARRMMKNGWSIKDTIRFIVTSETWQSDSAASEAAREKDPENRLLSHANVQRLDAESIRDSLLAVSGQLDSEMYGPGFRANGQEMRRSVYVTARRNSLDEFLKTFDSPTPFATTGRRSVTNVPAQSLTMLNDPFVKKLAEMWSASTEGPTDARISSMFGHAFGRAATNEELATFRQYVDTMQAEFRTNEMQHSKLSSKIADTKKAIAQITDPAREQLLKKRENEKKRGETSSDNESDLKPVAAWNFANGLEAIVGEQDVILKGDAKIKNGGLQLVGGYAHTNRLSVDLKEKTLAATVQLETLDQSGGGVITVQTRDGVAFDSIVFAEREPNRWIAGSEGFARTEDLYGGGETAADKEPVHVAITYAKDGTIRFYRNGKLYGNASRKSGLREYRRKNSQILFGIRHGMVDGDDKGRRLLGTIFTAQVFDRQLSDDEVANLAGEAGAGNYVSEKMLVDSLPNDQKLKLARLKKQLATLEAERTAMPEQKDANEAWTRLAHAIFNLKEFIYIR